MALEFYGRENLELIETEAARSILRAATFFADAHKGLLSVGNPRPYKTPSVPGQYPKVRTGALKKGTQYFPRQLAQVKREGRVRVGYLQSVFYGLVLELKLRRLGLLETLRRTRQQIAAFAVNASFK